MPAAMPVWFFLNPSYAYTEIQCIIHQMFSWWRSPWSYSEWFMNCISISGACQCFNVLLGYWFNKNRLHMIRALPVNRKRIDLYHKSLNHVINWFQIECSGKEHVYRLIMSWWLHVGVHEKFLNVTGTWKGFEKKVILVVWW